MYKDAFLEENVNVTMVEDMFAGKVLTPAG